MFTLRLFYYFPQLCILNSQSLVKSLYFMHLGVVPLNYLLISLSHVTKLTTHLLLFCTFLLNLLLQLFRVAARHMQHMSLFLINQLLHNELFLSHLAFQLIMRPLKLHNNLLTFPQGPPIAIFPLGITTNFHAFSSRGIPLGINFKSAHRQFKYVKYKTHKTQSKYHLVKI